MKIYLVDSGEYEQCIEAAFSTEELAQKFIDIYKPGASVIEMDLDQYVEQMLTPNKLYHCFWYENREHPRANIELNTQKEINKLYVDNPWIETSKLYCYLYAASEQEAISRFIEMVKSNEPHLPKP